MTEVSTSRLIYRSLVIHRNRQHRFLLEHNSRTFTTGFVSKKRALPLGGRFQFSKRADSSHHNRFFARCLSDLHDLKTDITSDSIDDAPHIAPSLELSSDDSVLSGSSDSFELFLDAFPRSIKDNVNGVISKVDVGRTSIRNRWQGIVRKEKERHRRRNKARSNTRRFDHAARSIQSQWDDALRRRGFYIIPKSLGEEEIAEPTIDMVGTAEELSQIDAIDELSHDDIYLSPIFGFHVNQQTSSIDFETALPMEETEEYGDRTNHIEVQRLLSNSSIDEEAVDRIDLHNNAIFESIALLIAMRREDWRKYDSSVHSSADGNNSILADDETDTEKESVDDATNLDSNYDDENKIREFLRHVMDHKYVLKTSDVNLLLAHLVTSTDDDNQEIADSCLRIYKEMKMLGKSGQHDGGPDSTTYRLLILAFSRRFQAMGEALKISQEMVEHSSIDIKPELLNEALIVCRSKTELNVARLLMDSAIRKNRITMNAASCIIFTEMLKTRKLEQEAIEVFRRIKEANLLTQRDEDEYLISLCRWPQRSRRGDVLDLSSFWTDIRSILEQKTLHGNIPDIRVWLTFLEGVYESAKNDDSLWRMAAGATRRVLDTYSQSFVGRKLMTIGIEAGFHIEDTELISSILTRLASEPPKIQPNVTAEDSERIMRTAKVPFRALKNSLKICLKTSDATSAQSILEAMNQIGDPYPTGAKYELFSLVLKCHAKVNDAESAKHLLNTMIENEMKPSEELYSEVLRTMAATSRYEEMEELFQSMQNGQEDGIEPGILSYDAMLFARIEEKSWDDVYAIYDEMKAKDIRPSSHTVKGLITAYDQKDGRNSVVSALESLLLGNAQFDESVFRLASEILFQEVNDNLDDFRKVVREIGEGNPDLRDASLDLVRSIRSAEVESGRPKIVHDSKHDAKHSGEDAWRVAITKLLVFSQALFESRDEIE